MFFRTILEFIAALIIFALLRSLIGALGRIASSAMHPPAAEETRRRQSDIASAGELRRDPVCGTFVSTTTSTKSVVKGETVYFCSAECRDRFAVMAK